MPSRRPLAALALAACVALLVPASVALAGVFPGVVIDGPAPDIASVGGVSLASDGSGTVVYVKGDGGVPHVFAAQEAVGAWQAPQRVDVGLAAPASQPVVAVTDAGRAAIAFVSGGVVYATLRPAGAAAFAPAVPLAPGSDPAIDMSVNGSAYVVFSSGSQVRAANATVTAAGFTLLADPLNLDPAQPAGSVLPGGRPRVAASADGTAVAVWGERGADGREHVIARRLLRTALGQVPQDLNVPALAGHVGGDADSPDVDIQYDSSYAWITYRQQLDGVPRALARRMVGSQLSAPVVVDGQGFPATDPAGAPDIAMNGTGGGVQSVGRGTSRQVFGTTLTASNTFRTPVRLDSAPANLLDPQPAATFGEIGDGYVAWLQSTGPADPPALHGRAFDNRRGWRPESRLTNLALGAVDPAGGFAVSSDRLDDVAVVAVQAAADGTRRLVAAMVDGPPRRFFTLTRNVSHTRIALSWTGALDLWGPVRYQVQIDGRTVGRTPLTHLTLHRRLCAARHRWRVVATDRRGQHTPTSTRVLVVHGGKPCPAKKKRK